MSKLLVSLVLVFGRGIYLVAQSDVCPALMAKGIFDEHQTFTDRQNFQYVQSVICSNQTMTRDQASSNTLASGGNYLDAISGFLNDDDRKRSFEEQRNKFCSMNLDISNNSNTLLSKSKVISRALMETIQTCLTAPGFHVLIVPAESLNSFAIQFIYNGSATGGSGNSNISVEKILTSESVDCEPRPPVTIYSGSSIMCSKPPDKSVLVSVNTDKGGMNAKTVYGTDTVLADLQNQVKALTDEVAALKSTPPPRSESVDKGSDKCRVMEDLQFCWGSKEVAVGPINSTFTGNVVFASPFAVTPQILFSTVGDSSKDMAYALFAGSADTTTARFEGVETTRGRATPGLPVTVTYMAIGKPQ